MYWKRWVLIFLVVTILIAAFEIAFQLLFKPEAVAVLRGKLFSGQQRGGDGHRNMACFSVQLYRWRNAHVAFPKTGNSEQSRVPRLAGTDGGNGHVGSHSLADP
jgi:hypothetical protein